MDNQIYVMNVASQEYVLQYVTFETGLTLKQTSNYLPQFRDSVS